MATSILRKFSACRSSREEKCELADLGHPVHQFGDLPAELALQVGLGGGGVLEDVVEEAGGHRGDVHLEVDEKVGDFEGVRQVGLAGGALLALVRGLRESVGPRHQVQVGARLILGNLLDQRLELSQAATTSA